MVVNQSQVDQILSAASEDDPEVKLQNLEREVDLIKTSIKRLLIDIRERLNDIDNPFTTDVSGAGARGDARRDDLADAHQSALEAREAALDAREENVRSTELERDKRAKLREEPDDEEESLSPVDRQILDALKAQMAGPMDTSLPTPGLPNPFVPAPGLPAPIAPPSPPASDHLSEARMPDRMRLQKAYRPVKWTNRAVKKYGHDRLETMLQSYCSMGYITHEACDEVSEIARLMPTVLGEVHEIDPGEYVSELYVLNRILSPNDLTLDRDMIEVLMEQRQQTGHSEDISRDVQRSDEWINLLDRI